jgi:hypothetical protein
MPTSRAADKVNSRATWFSAIAQLLSAGGGAAPAAQLAARFQSFADTIQTRLDTSSAVGPTLTGSLEAQVDRALSQVTRQAGANWSGGMPGQALTALAAQALSATNLAGGSGGPPAIAPQQAALLQEGTLIKGDALSVLDTLQPLSTFADPSDVTSVTAIMRAEINLLVEEFARTTLRPRAQRVRVLLGGLVGWNPPAIPVVPPYQGDTGSFLTLLNLGGPLVPTLLLDQQVASQQVLGNDAAELLNQWMAYLPYQLTIPPPWGAPGSLFPRVLPPGSLANLGATLGGGATMALGPATPQNFLRLAVISLGAAPSTPSYAERLIQADLLLPVLGQDAGRVAGALDAIGLSAAEQETTYVAIQSLVDMDLLRPGPPPGTPASLAGPPPPGFSVVNVQMTVTDILDWTASMADAAALDLIRQAGQLGLNLLADQADELFWIVIGLLYPGTQMTELGDAQVQTELITLARDLNLLANLAL